MTTNEDVLLKEVDEDLNQERQLNFLKRYGPWVGGAAAALVIGVGVMQALKGQRDTALSASAEAYVSAVLEPPENPTVAADALNQITSQLDGGYRGLAAMREGALRAAAEQPDEAMAAYRVVYNDEALPIRLRDLARLRAGYLIVETDPALANELASAVTIEAYRDHAQEIIGLAAMQVGDFGDAHAVFSALAENNLSSIGSRAAALAPLADVGRSGVALEPEASEANDFLDSFTDQLGADGLIPAPASGDDEN